MSNLFCVAVSAKSSVTVVVPDDRDLIITRAALAGTQSGATILLMKGEQDQAFVLGTLRSPQTEQFELDINIAAGSSVDFSVTGPNEVHLTGYHSALGYDDYSGSEFGSSDDEEGLSGLLDMDGYNSSEDDDFSSGQVESLDDDEGSVEDSGDDEMEEEESPKKVTQKNFTPAQTFTFGVDKKAAQPEAKKPEAKKPEAKKPEAKKPEAPKPTEKKPEAKKPVEAAKPVEKKPEAKKPAEAAKPAPAAQQKQATPEGKGQKRAPTTPESQPQAKKQKTDAAPATSPAGAFTCGTCGKSFKAEAGMKQHQVSTKHS